MSHLATFTPLMRQTIGFDRFNDLFESLLSDKPEERFEAYPPYNIEKVSDDAYRIEVAVAGFRTEDLNIVSQDDRLVISGRHAEEINPAQQRQFLHRGIATRAFERTFRLADHIRVESAGLENGLLSISLVREVPEEKKPRMIPISTGESDENAFLVKKETAAKKKDK